MADVGWKGSRMDRNELKKRTKRFALDDMDLVEAFPKTMVGRAIGGQLIRCATSVGANYRAACRGRSNAEFIAKIGIVEEEADEAVWWLDLAWEGGLQPERDILALPKEADELTAIFTATGRTAKRNSIRNKSAIRHPPSEI